jgi:hypothetical protein
VGWLGNFQTSAQSKQSPKRRKFAQSGQPDFPKQLTCKLSYSGRLKVGSAKLWKFFSPFLCLKNKMVTGIETWRRRGKIGWKIQMFFSYLEGNFESLVILLKTQKNIVKRIGKVGSSSAEYFGGSNCSQAFFDYLCLRKLRFLNSLFTNVIGHKYSYAHKNAAGHVRFQG